MDHDEVVEYLKAHMEDSLTLALSTSKILNDGAIEKLTNGVEGTDDLKAMVKQCVENEIANVIGEAYKIGRERGQKDRLLSIEDYATQ